MIKSMLKKRAKKETFNKTVHAKLINECFNDPEDVYKKIDPKTGEVKLPILNGKKLSALSEWFDDIGFLRALTEQGKQVINTVYRLMENREATKRINPASMAYGVAKVKIAESFYSVANPLYATAQSEATTAMENATRQREAEAEIERANNEAEAENRRLRLDSAKGELATLQSEFTAELDEIQRLNDEAKTKIGELETTNSELAAKLDELKKKEKEIERAKAEKKDTTTLEAERTAIKSEIETIRNKAKELIKIIGMDNGESQSDIDALREKIQVQQEKLDEIRRQYPEFFEKGCDLAVEGVEAFKKLAAASTELGKKANGRDLNVRNLNIKSKASGNSMAADAPLAPVEREL